MKTKKITLFDKFFLSQTEILLFNLQKLFEIPGFPGFSVIFVLNSRLFSKF